MEIFAATGEPMRRSVARERKADIAPPMIMPGGINYAMGKPRQATMR
jgi:hypothetical protein